MSNKIDKGFFMWSKGLIIGVVLAISFVGMFISASMYAPIDAYIFLNKNIPTTVAVVLVTLLTMLAIIAVIYISLIMTLKEYHGRGHEDDVTLMRASWVLLIATAIYMFSITKSSVEIEGIHYQKVLKIVQTGRTVKAVYRSFENGEPLTYGQVRVLLDAAEVDKNLARKSSKEAEGALYKKELLKIHEGKD